MNNTVLGFRQLVAIISLLIAWSDIGAAETPPLWGKLTGGPYAVGFKSTWQLDYSRRYNTTFDDKTTYAIGKAPRPILINMWYPAKRADNARAMPHRDYLAIQSADPHLAKFSIKLADYEYGVIAKEVMEKRPKDLTDREKTLLNQFLDMPTACVREAPPAVGRFPLVIYHSGAGSSFEDNAVFCEFLASHGFVVLGSAFPDQSGKSFNTDNREGSAHDIAFLIAYARQQPNIDWNHIGLIGHSAGAQASLVYRSQPGSPVDAVVSLDTTQDYHGVSDPLWHFTPEVVKNAKNIDCPLLMAAGPNAFFELADSLRSAERFYFTLNGMAHNDYIAQGGIHNDRLYQLHLGDQAVSADARAEEKAAMEKSKSGYEALCNYVLRFFEAMLKAEPAGKEFLAKQYRSTQFGGTDPHVEYVPIGRTGPDAYMAGSKVPPTPRQLRPFFNEHGSEKTIALLRRFRKQFATHPIYTENFEFYLVIDLLDQNRIKDALAFRDEFRESGLDCNKALLAIGKGYQKIGLARPAAIFYKRLLLLDPSNREAAGKLKEVEEGSKK